jgi:hypothetical protein
MAGLVAFAAWIAICRWGGPGIRTNQGEDSALRPTARASFLRAVVSTFLLSSWVIAGWLPIVGLIRLAMGDAWLEVRSVGGALRGLSTLRQHLSEPPVPRLAWNSLVLGLEVALALMVVAWLVGRISQSPSSSSSRTGRVRLEQWLARMPPLSLGVGVLSLSWLAGLAAATLVDAGRLKRLSATFEWFSRFSDGDRNPWIPLTVSVGLSLAAVVLTSGRRAVGLPGSQSTSALDAAQLAGASRSRARALSMPRRRRQWLGLFILIWVLAATNLSPALLFTPWSDGRTAAPGIVDLANGGGDARARAASLALCVVAVNLAAVVVARLTAAPPRSDS